MNNKISIICPVYNSEPFLEKCILSVVNQTKDNWELVLIDDGSTDDSGLICDRFATLHKNIVVFHKKNEGQMKARVDGIKASTGDLIAFLDSDDLLQINAVESIANIFSANPSADCIIFNGTVFPKNSKSKNIPNISENCVFTSNSDVIQFAFGKQMYGYLWMYCFKRNVLIESLSISNNYLNVRYTEDGAFIFNALCSVNKMVTSVDTLYKYRENPNSITHTLTNNDRRDRFLVFNYIYETIFKKYKNFILNKEYYVELSWVAFSYLEHIMDKHAFKLSFSEVRRSFLFSNIIKKTKTSSSKFKFYRLLLIANFKNSLYMVSHKK